MKRNLLLCATLFGITITNCFALPLTQAKILSHKERATPNVLKYSFNETSSERGHKLSLLRMFNQVNHSFPTNSEYVTTTNTISQNSLARVGTPVLISGKSEFVVQNGSFETKDYTLETSICVFAPYPGPYACATSEQNIEVLPKEDFTQRISPVLAITLDKAQTYDSMILTVAYRDGSPIFISTSNGQVIVSQ